MCYFHKSQGLDPNGPVDFKQNPIKDMNILRKINELPNAQCIVNMKNGVHLIAEPHSI